MNASNNDYWVCLLDGRPAENSDANSGDKEDSDPNSSDEEGEDDAPVDGTQRSRLYPFIHHCRFCGLTNLHRPQFPGGFGNAPRDPSPDAQSAQCRPGVCTDRVFRAKPGKRRTFPVKYSSSDFQGSLRF